MPYVNRDGTITDVQPWGLGKLMTVFWGTVDFFLAFFQTLIPYSTDESGFRSGSGGGTWRGSGGSSNGGGGFGGGPRPRPRPPAPPSSGSNVHGMSDLPPPPPSCGSCCGR